MTADIILHSNAVFTGLADLPSPGYVAVAGNRILAVDSGGGLEWSGPTTRVYELGDRLICPGFSDVHCFFTGYLLAQIQADLSAARTAAEVIAAAESNPSAHTDGGAILACGVRSDIQAPDESALDSAFGDVPAILFVQGGETCWMNAAARRTFGFTPETCWSESYWRLLRYLLNDRKRSVPAFKKYLAMLNSRGVTSVKEMGFDDFYGFTDVLAELEHKGEFTMRVHFMSQPVGAPMNLPYGRAMRDRFQGEFVRFSGYNQMTDGSISQLEGDMKEPYCCTDTCCAKKIDWDGLRADALAADAEGFRFSLHAQGDAAIGKVLDIYEKCLRDTDGKVLNRHAITDLECSDPADLERMGRLGVIAEIYPQIMSIADRAGKLAMIEEKIGLDRGRNYWNRRKMAESGVVLSCATDLPLLVDDIPESVYHSVGALFPEGGEPFNKQNTLTVGQLLSAWTRGGQYNLGRESELGTLEAGKLADIAVLDTNLFAISPEDARDSRVCLTLVDGRVVWEAL
ncbi:amidohydrolase [Caproiciproducens sp.]|uniref:amidohydrolase n=1 Tax=Caproiciproducens sp. TaxID=1954376 RepID=UPI002899F27C|nr:amidohydrolase family protein [Caproiciproducens sp.]